MDKIKDKTVGEVFSSVKDARIEDVSNGFVRFIRVVYRLAALAGVLWLFGCAAVLLFMLVTGEINKGKEILIVGLIIASLVGSRLCFSEFKSMKIAKVILRTLKVL